MWTQIINSILDAVALRMGHRYKEVRHEHG